ncbi:hypothetical protein TrVFT333_007864 [Trichoderma virens FT-333]|nr:hypothetical protein TrVFT333_007864 [Trichoderma virens FT-333]
MLSAQMLGVRVTHRSALDLHFTVHQAATPFTVSLQAYLAAHPDSRYSYIATGTLVFDHAQQMGVTGCGCDDDDESILHAAARELWEETGLKAIHLGAPVGEPHFFSSESRKRICKFVFPMQVETNNEGHMTVTLDPREHQCFAWASEEEVKAKRIEDIELDFTTKDLVCTVLEAFSQFKKIENSGDYVVIELA